MHMLNCTNTRDIWTVLQKLTKIVCKSIRILTVLFEIPPLKSVKFFLKKMHIIKSENSGHSKISEEDFEGSYKWFYFFRLVHLFE